MTTVSDLSDIPDIPLSGLNHIDALLDRGRYWNLQAAGGNAITYTFSTSSGNQTFSNASPAPFTGGLETMNAAQQAGVRTAFAYVSSLTGLVFKETNDGNAASLHLANANLKEADTPGLFSATEPGLKSFIYLDNAEWAADNYSLLEGGFGFETLLHELGHVLGLKHPFEGDIQLPDGQDTTAYSLMAYDIVGGPYAHFSPYDVAALNWLYGGDGLGGAIGVGSASGARYITGTERADQLTGTAANDILQGLGGDDKIVGGAGVDKAVFAGARANYTIASAANGFTVRGTAGEIDSVSSVERLKFDDGAVALDLTGAGGQAYRLYQAAFDRTPDLKGLGYWINSLDMGYTLKHIAGQFVASPEFTAKFGAQSDAKFVDTLYDHVLHRLPDESGYAFWLAALNTGWSRAHLLEKFSESAENQAQVIGQIANGLDYQVWMG